MPPPIPFPFPFGMRIGTDICHIPRIVQSFYSKTWPRFVRRILTEEELANARSAVTELLDEHESIIAARQQPKGPYEGRGPNADPKKLDLAATFLAGRCVGSPPSSIAASISECLTPAISVLPI